MAGGHGGRGMDAAGRVQGMGVYEGEGDDRVGFFREKPERMPTEKEQDEVGERARAETPADGEMHDVPEAPSFPLVVVELRRHRGEAVGGASAATARRADEELTAGTSDVHGAAVGANDDGTAARVHAADYAIDVACASARAARSRGSPSATRTPRALPPAAIRIATP